MADKVTGQVFKVYEKQFPNKPMTYSVKLEDNPIYYRMGKKRDAGIVEPGKVISFEATMNSDGKSANIEGEVTEIVRSAQAAPASGTPSFSGDRQNSIIYQSSRKDALDFVKLLYAQGAIEVPKKKADAVGAIEAVLDRYTAAFFADVNTLGAVVREAESEGAEAGESEKDSDDGE